MQIRSIRIIRLRVVVGVLADRGFSLFRVAEAAAVPILELRRLIEFGALPDPLTIERLDAFAAAVLSAKPEPARLTPPPIRHFEPVDVSRLRRVRERAMRREAHAV